MDSPLFYFYRGYSLYSLCCMYSIAASGWIQLMMTCKCYVLSFFLGLKPNFRILYCHPLGQVLRAFCIKSVLVAKTLQKGTEPLLPLRSRGKNLCQRRGFVSLAGRRAGGRAAQAWGCECCSCTLLRVLAGPATSYQPSPWPSMTGRAALGNKGKTPIRGPACFCTCSLLVETSRRPRALTAASPPSQVKCIYLFLPQLRAWAWHTEQR